MSDLINIPCSECQSLIEVSYEDVKEIWEWEERTGDKFTCSDCPDAYQKSQLSENREGHDAEM